MLSNFLNTAAAVMALMPLAALAAPANTFAVRAGGPAIKDIPQSCSLPGVYPYPFSTSFKTTPDFEKAHQIYSFTLDEKTGEDPTFNETQHAYQCLEQCYGYGDPGQCKGALWSYNATDNEHGTTTPGVGCFMYDAPITTADLVGTSDSTFTRARAVNIQC